MFKETVICIIIIITIFSLDIFTQKYTEDTTKDITKLFLDLKDEILKENKDEIKAKISKLDDKWKEKHDKLAYYIEHDELEKVKTALTSVRSFVEVEEYSDGVEAIDKCMYILDHIHERERFSLDNIL